MYEGKIESKIDKLIIARYITIINQSDRVNKFNYHHVFRRCDNYHHVFSSSGIPEMLTWTSTYCWSLTRSISTSNKGNRFIFPLWFGKLKKRGFFRPLGVPHLKKVILFNVDNNRTIDMTSISGSTVHFHSSFFEEKVIKVDLEKEQEYEAICFGCFRRYLLWETLRLTSCFWAGRRESWRAICLFTRLRDISSTK